MNTFAIVPVKRFENSKTRLSAVLSDPDRIRLSSFMAERTLDILRRSSGIERIVVVTSEPSLVIGISDDSRIAILKEPSDMGVNAAVAVADSYCTTAGADASLVVPADLPLLEPSDVNSLVESGKKITSGIIISPSLRLDGTNALLRSPPDILSTQYDNDSFRNHIRTAENDGLQVVIERLPRVMADLDDPGDIERVIANCSPSNAVATFLKATLSVAKRQTRG